MAIDRLPVRVQTTQARTQDPRGQIRLAHPRQHQVAHVVAPPGAVLWPSPPGPSPDNARAARCIARPKPSPAARPTRRPAAPRSASSRPPAGNRRDSEIVACTPASPAARPRRRAGLPAARSDLDRPPQAHPERASEQRPARSRSSIRGSTGGGRRASEAVPCARAAPVTQRSHAPVARRWDAASRTACRQRVRAQRAWPAGG